MFRFFANLLEHEDLVKAMFEELVRKLKAALPDLGRHFGFDGKAIPSFSTGSKDRTTGQTGDPYADWGTKTSRGANDKGRRECERAALGRVGEL